MKILFLALTIFAFTIPTMAVTEVCGRGEFLRAQKDAVAVLATKAQMDVWAESLQKQKNEGNFSLMQNALIDKGIAMIANGQQERARKVAGFEATAEGIEKATFEKEVKANFTDVQIFKLFLSVDSEVIDKHATLLVEGKDGGFSNKLVEKAFLPPFCNCITYWTSCYNVYDKDGHTTSCNNETVSCRRYQDCGIFWESMCDGLCMYGG